MCCDLLCCCVCWDLLCCCVGCEMLCCVLTADALHCGSGAFVCVNKVFFNYDVTMRKFYPGDTLFDIFYMRLKVKNPRLFYLLSEVKRREQ